MIENYLDIPNTREHIKPFEFFVGRVSYKFHAGTYDATFMAILKDQPLSDDLMDGVRIYLEYLYLMVGEADKKPFVDLPSFIKGEGGQLC